MNISIYSDSSNIGTGIFMVFFALFMAFWVLMMIYSVMYLVSMYKVFQKCGRKGWYSLIPLYNNWVLFDLAGEKPWLSLIPFVNVVFMYISLYRIFSKFDKTSSYPIVATILYFIFIPVVGLSKAEYEEEDIYHNMNYQSGQKNYDDYTYCLNCGVRGTGKFCVKCGNKLK